MFLSLYNNPHINAIGGMYVLAMYAKERVFGLKCIIYGTNNETVFNSSRFHTIND
jgi:hypothetical protein